MALQYLALDIFVCSKPSLSYDTCASPAASVTLGQRPTSLFKQNVQQLLNPRCVHQMITVGPLVAANKTRFQGAEVTSTRSRTAVAITSNAACPLQGTA